MEAMELGVSKTFMSTRGGLIALVLILGMGSVASFQDAFADENGSFKVVDSFNVGENVYVRALTVEKEAGKIWVGSSVGVLEIELASKKMLNSFTRESGLANEYVFAIGIDKKGNKWFGTNAGGVSRYKDGEWKTFFPMHGLADYWVYSFANQKNGDFWIGTWAGANRIDAKTGKWTTYFDELINEWVYGAATDSKDRVWFATEGGVSMYDNGKWTSWTIEDGVGSPDKKELPRGSNAGLGTRTRHDLGVMSGGDATYNANYIFSVHVTPEDDVWVGTWGGGVSVYRDGNWTNYSTKDGLAAGIVYSIDQDESGALWFGTSAGVTRFDGEKWLTVDSKAGLLDDNVYAVAVVPGGDVWVGTKYGVSIIANK